MVDPFDPYASYLGDLEDINSAGRASSDEEEVEEVEEVEDVAQEEEDAEEEEDEDEADLDDFELVPSPRRRKGGESTSGRRAGAGGKRTHAQWEMLSGARCAKDEVDDAVVQHGKKVAAGRGFTACGSWRSRKKPAGATKLWRCTFKDCKAQLRAVADECGACQLYVSAADDKKHNNHMERDQGVNDVPGEIRALLTPTKLDYGPKRARAFLRKKTLADGMEVPPPPICFALLPTYQPYSLALTLTLQP
jgi:hypothetical protein